MVLKVYRGISQQAVDIVRIKRTLAKDRHFTFWGDLTKTVATIVCVHKFNSRLVV